MRNFFEHQRVATAQSARLVFWFFLAIILTAIGTSAVLTLGFVAVWNVRMTDHTYRLIIAAAVFAGSFLITSVGMAIASWLKMRQLRDGGHVIAEALGGRLIDGTSSDRLERRALNVVEEMAVATGIAPPPAVYLLDGQAGINAFAAGLSVEDAVVAVTRGAVQRLSRDQLQGVVGHEFSHVVNGDMRLNMSLVGGLYGIYAIPRAAEFLITEGIDLMSKPPRDKDDGSPFLIGLVMVIVGALIWPVGLVGTMVGLFIVRATSRQREFLADASAAQFTRHPAALADALKTIVGHAAGSRVRSHHAMEASHFFFANGTNGWSNWLSTHPPITERIRRLDPEWDGIPLFENEDQLEDMHESYQSSLSLVNANAMGLAANESDPSPVEESLSADEESRGPDYEIIPRDALAYNEQLTCEVRSSLPAELVALLDDGDGVAVVLASLWYAPFELAARNFELLPSSHRPLVQGLLPTLTELDDAQQLVLLDECFERLRGGDTRFRDTAVRVLRPVLESTDREHDTTAHWSMRHQISGRLGLARPLSAKVRYGKLADVREACEILLSALCHAGSRSDEIAQYAFHRAAVHLDFEHPDFWLHEQIDFGKMDVAIEWIAETAARARRQLFVAMACCVTADQGIHRDEAEIVRCLCARLNMPLPRLLPGHAVMPGT